MPEHRAQLIEKLTGVNASKRNYYTELKEKILEITKRNSQLEILNELARQISINTPLDQIVGDVSTRVKEIIPFDRVSLLTFRDEKLYLNCFNPPDNVCFTGMEITPERGKALWDVKEKRQQQVWEIGAGIEDLHLAGLGLKVAVISPLFSQNKVFGLFVVASTRSLVYDPADLTFLQQLANQLAICLQDQELFAEVTRAKVEWEATFKAVRDLIVVVDKEMRVFRFNLATAEFCGLPEEEIVGKKCCEIICSSTEPCGDCAVREALRTGETANTQHRLEDGRVMELHAYPALWQDEKLGVVIYAKDITENLKMQVQLLKAARLAALGEMAAGVAHELNTPLTVIIGDAQLLMRNFPADDKNQKLFEDIKNCGLRCKQIVQGLLTFSRQEQYVFYSLSPNDVVEAALKLVTYQIETNNIKLDVTLDPGIPKIEGNAQQLEQVLVNLLLNAAQSFEGKEGKREIRVRTGFDRDRNQVFIEVSDTGQGISPENLSQIFDPFFTSKGVGKGTGLGLSVSLGIVQTHGGTISVESRVGEGSTFTVYLPPFEGSDEVAS
ncbi:MAG TPA: PAS domain-containing protein [Syntrophomonadaceae bacterium]|nr:PAS domain-containing protein [Syntrophomonadaceae bacterium]